MSRGQSQPRNQSVKRVLERCRTRDTIEIIDVEEKINLVIVDAEDDQGSRGSGTTRRNSWPSDVISIHDDDGDADDTLKNVHADATSKERCPASSNSSVSEESGSNVSSMPIRMGNPRRFKSMDYMRKYDDIGPSVNQYGLDYSLQGCSSDSDRIEFNSKSICSDSDSSDSDSSDCEIMEGSSGNIREQWERAALRKKISDRVRYGSVVRASALGSSADAALSSQETTCSKADIENCINMVHTNHSEEMLVEPYPNNPNSINEKLSFNMHSLAESGEKFSYDTTDLDTDTTNNIDHKEPKFASETFSHRAQSMHDPLSDDMRSGLRDDDDVNSLDENEQVRNGTTFGTSGLPGDFSFPEKVVQVPGQLDGEQFLADSTVQDKNKHLPGEPSLSLKPQFKSVSSPEIAGFQEKGKSSFDKPSSCNDRGSDMPVLNSETSLKESPACNTNEGRGTFGKSILFDTGPGGIPQVDNGLICRERHKESDEYKRAVEEEWAARQRQLQIQSSTRMGDLLGSPGGIPQVDNGLICRERHKESDEYKRAVEEEWAARQRQLQIQAKEVQRLKRRRKAETLRLLDMEKRQKQRLEEMRESQKKDEETITLKEHIRAEVRKELNNMELRYRDMASLLRGLGIHVKGGVFPMPHEVNAAYKQALLKFHPDRALKYDIREQVKAEEIFKLISRLKEKLML